MPRLDLQDAHFAELCFPIWLPFSGAHMFGVPERNASDCFPLESQSLCG